MSDARSRAPLAPRVVATGIAATYLVATAGTLVVRVYAHESLGTSYIVPFTVYTVVGWLIATRQPRVPLGWVFLGIGLLTSIGQIGDATVALAVRQGWACKGVVMLAAWSQLWFWYPLIALATVGTLLLYPNGLPSRRWRPVLWLLALTVTAMTVSSALVRDVDFGKHKVHNPIGVLHVSAVEHTWPWPMLNVMFAVVLLASVVSLGVRFRRSTGLVRAQLKWFFLVAGFLAVTLILALTAPSENDSAVGNALLSIGLTALPAACGIAISRYRLYDIDRIVSRSVGYMIVTGVVVGFYVGVVALIDGVLGFSSSIAAAASTLAAAALFQPLRRRVQRSVDRRFDRAAYDARRTVEHFAAQLRDEVDVDAVRGELLDVVSSAVVPAQASLWLAS